MNQRIAIVFKSLLIGLMVVLLTYLLIFVFVFLGMYRPHPGLFFSVIYGVSMFQGWLMYGLMAFGLSWLWLLQIPSIVKHKKHLHEWINLGRSIFSGHSIRNCHF